jgi:hypothetical protein
MGGLPMTVYCDAPDCWRRADWMIGLSTQPDIVRGHPVCDKHLSQGCRVSYVQLYGEGRKGEPIEVWPVLAVVAEIPESHRLAG